MKETETKWYEKASGRKQHSAENVAKHAARAELKKQRREEKSSDEKSDSSPKAGSRNGRNSRPSADFSRTGRDTSRPASKSPRQDTFRPDNGRNFRRTDNHASRAVTSRVSSMFDSKNVPEDAVKILAHFDEIVAEVRNMSGKQQTLLAGQIKKMSHQLTDDRSSRRIGYMNDASSISAYISYFMWWNLVRLTRLFANLPKDAFKLSDNDICLDLGSGPLTVPVALWLSRPELRSKKLTFYCLDLSQTALAAGEEIYLNIAAKTIQQNQEPWKIIRVKGPVGTGIREKAALVTSANVFNELAQTSEMMSDYLAKKYTGDIENYFEKSGKLQTVLVIEPGDPHSARLVSLMRDAFIRRGFMPVSPCPHIHICPMEGRTSSNPQGKWCNFAFDTADAPANLLKLSEKANLTKDRAVLSYVLARRNDEKVDAAAKGDTAASGSETKNSENRSLLLRVASDFIRLPELHKSGWYCCSEMGLVLAVDQSNTRPVNGDLLKTKKPSETERLAKDAKSGALLLTI